MFCFQALLFASLHQWHQTLNSGCHLLWRMCLCWICILVCVQQTSNSNFILNCSFISSSAQLCLCTEMKHCKHLIFALKMSHRACIFICPFASLGAVSFTAKKNGQIKGIHVNFSNYRPSLHKVILSRTTSSQIKSDCGLHQCSPLQIHLIGYTVITL